MAGAVTDLKVHPRRADKIRVYLDGRHALTVSRLLASRLRVGQALSDEELEGLAAAEAEEQAYQRALRFLGRRPHSEAELREKLAKRQTPVDAVERVIARLKDHALIDDVTFAKAWVENRETYRPRAAKALRAELRRKGVATQAIQAALEDFDEASAAAKAAAKAWRKYQSLPEPVARRRLMDYLSRRGFGYGLCRTIVEKALRGTLAPPDESEVIQ